MMSRTYILPWRVALWTLCNYDKISNKELLLFFTVLQLVESTVQRTDLKSPEEKKVALLNFLRKDGYNYAAKLLNGLGCASHTEVELQARKRDHISHYILRLAYSQNQELRRWFVNMETEYIKLRFSSLNKEGILMLLSLNNFDYSPVSIVDIYISIFFFASSDSFFNKKFNCRSRRTKRMILGKAFTYRRRKFRRSTTWTFTKYLSRKSLIWSEDERSMFKREWLIYRSLSWSLSSYQNSRPISAKNLRCARFSLYYQSKNKILHSEFLIRVILKTWFDLSFDLCIKDFPYRYENYSKFIHIGRKFKIDRGRRTDYRPWTFWVFDCFYFILSVNLFLFRLILILCDFLFY